MQRPPPVGLPAGSLMPDKQVARDPEFLRDRRRVEPEPLRGVIPAGDQLLVLLSTAAGHGLSLARQPQWENTAREAGGVTGESGSSSRPLPRGCLDCTRGRALSLARPPLPGGWWAVASR